MGDSCNLSSSDSKTSISSHILALIGVIRDENNEFQQGVLLNLLLSKFIIIIIIIIIILRPLAQSRRLKIKQLRLDMALIQI